jgi:hypothetical protein
LVAKIIKDSNLSQRQAVLMELIKELTSDMELDHYEMAAIGAWFVCNAVISVVEEDRADFKQDILDGIEATLKAITQSEAN